MGKDKIKFKEKLAYATVNFGNIPIMTIINGYLLIFYTNICGLSPAACATLFLIARILDGLNDPLVGFVIDHLPNTKFGHFRPTLIVGTILCSANFLLLWFGPMMAPSGKLAIAYVSYILLGVLFPVMDISLNSLLPVMTEDMNERNSLSSVKGLAYVVGALVVSVAAPLILGDTSNKDGYIKLILITVAVIFFCSIIGTLGVKERIKPQKEKSYTIKQLFQILSQKPVYITFLVVLLYTIGNNIVSAVNTYYYTYVLGNLSWAAILTLVMCVTIFPATMIVTKFIAKYGKKKIMIQITDDPRFYPQPLSEKQKYRLQKLDAVIEGVPGNGNKCLYPQGRTLENFDDSWWNTIAPKCVNVRLLAKQGVDSIRGIVNTLFRAGKVCTPSISPAGEIKLGESALCPSVASIYDTEQEIIEKIQRCRCQSCEYSWQQLKSISIKAFEMLEKN